MSAFDPLRTFARASIRGPAALEAHSAAVVQTLAALRRLPVPASVLQTLAARLGFSAADSCPAVASRATGFSGATSPVQTTSSPSLLDDRGIVSQNCGLRAFLATWVCGSATWAVPDGDRVSVVQTLAAPRRLPVPASVLQTFRGWGSVPCPATAAPGASKVRHIGRVRNSARMPGLEVSATNNIAT